MDIRQKTKLLERLEAKKKELAEAGMTHPKADPFEHGQQVGMYNGIVVAMQTIHALFRAEDKDEAED